MKNKLAQIKNNLNLKRQKILAYIDRRPLRSFFIVLSTVLLLILISNLLPKPTPPVTTSETTKIVTVYRIGTAPKVTVQAQIKKSGVITIVAQTGGIVNFLHVTEGSEVKRGTQLVNLASNYYGGNAATIQRQIASAQNETVKATYPTQKEILQKQKELAQKSDDNSDQLRDITARSIDETRGLIAINEQILTTIDQDLAILQQDPVTNRALILSTQQLKSSYTSALNQARASLRSSEYQSANNTPPAQISDISREIAIKQLEVQEKQLDLNKEVTNLQFRLAQVNEGIYYPVSPFSGTVQRVFVKPFEAVSPGTPLMILSQVVEEDPITAVAFVSKDIAQRASLIEASELILEDQVYAVTPSFISTEAVQGSLYAIYYPIPDEFNGKLVNEGFITVNIPVGYPDTSSVATYIPIDAIYQTRTSAYLFVIVDGKARAREVKLGQIFGRFVEIESGINSSDIVILDRNVIDGDNVKAN